jgi:hypothetical protein
MGDFVEAIKHVLLEVELFVEHVSGLRLRRYQEQVATLIAKSVFESLGLSFVVLFPRQSGKTNLFLSIKLFYLVPRYTWNSLRSYCRML